MTTTLVTTIGRQSDEAAVVTLAIGFIVDVDSGGIVDVDSGGEEGEQIGEVVSDGGVSGLHRWKWAVPVGTVSIF